MGCGSCGVKGADGLPGGCKNNGWCKSGGCGAILDVHDWLQNVRYLEGAEPEYEIIEVRFKGTRKEYYRNSAGFELYTGDMIVVESATQGYDVGEISLMGELVKLQMKKYKVKESSELVRRVVRPATESDIEKYQAAKEREVPVMMRSREIAISMGLTMKISDLEYQGDGSKATFFYTAEGRVDFRELIKQYAREFRVKIEMRQIGLRQEAGRLGGIGSCGRELCCSTWLTDFNSVPTTAARYQNLFLNPLKLSGQCGRLKCCLNFELDQYVEALEEFPDENTIIRTEKGAARIEKMDILKRVVWFKYLDQPGPGKLYAVELPKLYEMLKLTEEGVSLAELEEFTIDADVPEEMGFKDVVGEDKLDRFEHKNRGRNNNNRNRNNNNNNNNNGNNNPQQRNRNQGGPGSAQQHQRNLNQKPQQSGSAVRSIENEARAAGDPEILTPNEQRHPSGERRPNPKQDNRNQNRPPRNDNRGQRNDDNQNRGPRNDDNRGQRNDDNQNRGPRNDHNRGPRPENPNQGQGQQNNDQNRGPRNPNPNQNQERGPRNDNQNRGPRNPNQENRNQNRPPRNDNPNRRPDGESGPQGSGSEGGGGNQQE